MRPAALAGLALVPLLVSGLSPATARPTTEVTTTRSPAVASTVAALRIKVTPAAPLVDERFTVSGTAPGRSRARVLLERSLRAGEWRTVARARTNRAGSYVFARSTTKRELLRTRIFATRTMRRWVSPVRVVAPRRDSSTLTLTGTFDRTEARVALKPARPGRLVDLWVREGGSWRLVGASTPQRAGGTASWTLVNLARSTADYRIGAHAWHGARATTGAPARFTAGIRERDQPRLTLTTAGGAPIESKDVYVDGTVRVNGADLATKVKGRGNSTWLLPKKPFRLKLGSAAALIPGAPAEKDWVLLANYADPSLLRTWVAFGLAERTGLAWTPRHQFVDLVLNGVELGSYLLTEQVEVSPTKVALPAGGMLLEIDHRFDGPLVEHPDLGYRTALNTPIVFKDPGNPTPEEQAPVKAAVADLENRLYGPGFTDPTAGYRTVVDVGSFIDWYLVNEFTKNLDADFYSSVFVGWTPGVGFALGPVWDFDLSAGIGPNEYATAAYSSPEGWWVRDGRNKTHWIVRMLQDPWFADRVAARWAELSPQFAAVVDSVPAESTGDLRDSALTDWALWHAAPSEVPGSVHRSSYPGEVGYLVDWYRERLAWMNAQLLS